MSTTIVIQGTSISFPSSGESANWSQPIIAFAVATADALAGVVGTFDVAPQVMTIDAYNPGTSVTIPGLIFSTADVRGAVIKYCCHRVTTLTELSEEGEIQIVYNPSSGSGLKWEQSRSAVGDAQLTFSVTDVGQVQFSTIALSGLNHTGALSFSGVAILQS